MNRKFEKINNLLKAYEEDIQAIYSLRTPYTLIISSYRLTEDILYTYFNNNRQDINVPLRTFLRNENFPKKGYAIISDMSKYKNEAVHNNLTLDILSSFLKSFNQFLDWFKNFYGPDLNEVIGRITEIIDLIIEDIELNHFGGTDLKKLANCEKELEKLKNDAKFSFSKENEKNQIEEINVLLEIFENQLRILKDRDNFFDIFILGQKISESMIGLYLTSQNYSIKGYFSYMIMECSSKGILPNECVMFLLTLRRYRNKGIHGNEPSFDIISSFINALKFYLIWFNTFYSGKYSLKEPFNIEKSVILINLINEIGRSVDESVEKQITCPQCGSKDFIIDDQRDEIACKKCGIVIDKNLIDGPDFKEDIVSDLEVKKAIIKNKSNVSSKLPINNSFDEYVLDREGALRNQFRKMQRDASKTSGPRFKYPFLSYDMNKICSKLNLKNNIVERSSSFFMNILEEELDSGINFAAIMPVSIYITCRQYNVCRTLDEIAKASEVDKKEVEEACEVLVNELNINLPPVSLIDYVPRFAYEIGYSEAVLFLAIDIIENAMKKGFISTEDPVGVAVTSLYVASILLNEKKPQEEVENITNVSEETILKIYNQLIEEGVIEEINISQDIEENTVYNEDKSSIDIHKPSQSLDELFELSYDSDVFGMVADIRTDTSDEFMALEDADSCSARVESESESVSCSVRVETESDDIEPDDDLLDKDKINFLLDKSMIIDNEPEYKCLNKSFVSSVLVCKDNEIDLEIPKEKDIATVIEETNKKIEQLIKENEIKNNLLIQMANQVTLLQGKLDEVLQSTGRIEGKVDIIINEVKKINQTIEAIQDFTTFQIENSNSKIEIENIIENFSKQYISQLQSYSEEIIKKENYDIEKIKLEDSMGNDAWNKLSEKSKTFLITAKVLYNDLLRIKYIADYSGICILVTKALEEEIFKRFFTNFVDYLDKKYHKDYSQYPTALLFKDGTLLYEDRFTMGNIAFVLGFKENRYDTPEQIRNNDEKLIEYCKNQIFSNNSEEEIKELLNEYACYIEKIRKDYRNPSAHRNAIQKVNAVKCFELILDVEKLLKRMLESFDN